jgi:hypothetical protein
MISYLAAGFLYQVHWALGLIAVVVVFPGLVLIMRIISPPEWTLVKEIIGLRRA